MFSIQYTSFNIRGSVDILLGLAYGAFAPFSGADGLLHGRVFWWPGCEHSGFAAVSLHASRCAEQPGFPGLARFCRGLVGALPVRPLVCADRCPCGLPFPWGCYPAQPGGGCPHFGLCCRGGSSDGRPGGSLLTGGSGGLASGDSGYSNLRGVAVFVRVSEGGLPDACGGPLGCLGSSFLAGPHAPATQAARAACRRAAAAGGDRAAGARRVARAGSLGLCSAAGAGASRCG